MMENFLKKLYIISKEYKMLADREEKFNIFTALHKSHDERRLHSRFISVLLQPKGSHGFDSQFLNLFLKEVNNSGNSMPTKGSLNDEDDSKEIINEKESEPKHLLLFKNIGHTKIYPYEDDKKENENIDTLVIDRLNKQCIIIENKIYAGDSNGSDGQLNRYIDHILSVEKIPLENIDVVYLTLDGHEPSRKSIDKYIQKKEIILCSYHSLIIPWLEKCLTLTSRTPFVREAILQYIKLIKQMTKDDSSIEERKAYRKLIGESNENMIAARKLLQNFKHIKWHAVHDFWSALQMKIEENNHLITSRVVNEDGTSQVINELTHFEDYRKGQKKKQHCNLSFQIKNGLEISILFTPNMKFYFGISNKAKLSSEMSDKLNQLIKNKTIYRQTDWMVLMKSFNKNIFFNDFNQQLAFDLISSEKNQALVNDTWAEIASLMEDLEYVPNQY